MIIYKDTKYNFFEIFNPQNGFLYRGDIEGTQSTPVQRSFPELIDVGIMGSCHVASLGICKKAGVDCYQSAIKKHKPHMKLIDFQRIVKEASGKTFQIALGGAGDPNKHPDFLEILKLSRKYNIVPNLTTTGYFMSDNEISAMKTYCGAVAVSFYTTLKDGQESNPMTIEAINKLVKAGCRTNIHYVLSKNSIKDAVYRLEHNLFPQGINAIIFLLYKGTGLGDKINEISLQNKEFIHFLDLVQLNNFSFRIGFDTCCTPALLRKCQSVLENSLDFCEAARFSMYIDSELNAYPCSFDCDRGDFKVNMQNSTIKEVWDSEVFNQFRNIQIDSCSSCLLKNKCVGKCKLNLCNNLCSL